MMLSFAGLSFASLTDEEQQPKKKADLNRLAALAVPNCVEAGAAAAAARDVGAESEGEYKYDQDGTARVAQDNAGAIPTPDWDWDFVDNEKVWIHVLVPKDSSPVTASVVVCPAGVLTAWIPVLCDRRVNLANLWLKPFVCALV